MARVSGSQALCLLGGEVSPHPSRSVWFVLGWSARWREHDCALPRERNGAYWCANRSDVPPLVGNAMCGRALAGGR